ncbi:hypothetical protein ACIGEP_07210 [Microbacterium sp. NPDC077663]|uniref:hypothetical protein n=1 Tax=Microbacterium sp. NPDC077663 TaxID=3364189 RepID=UPI0037C56AEE
MNGTEGANAQTYRLAPTPSSMYSEEQAALVADYRRSWRSVVEAPDGSLGGPFDVTLQSPALARAMMPLADLVRDGLELPPLRREIVILVVAAVVGCSKVWGYHHGPAIAAGLSESDAERLRKGDDPTEVEKDDALAARIARQVASSGRVDDASYALAAGMFGSRGLVELVALAGYYRFIAELINLAQFDAGALA